jgi:hypothetical protein
MEFVPVEVPSPLDPLSTAWRPLVMVMGMVMVIDIVMVMVMVMVMVTMTVYLGCSRGEGGECRHQVLTSPLLGIQPLF